LVRLKGHNCGCWNAKCFPALDNDFGAVAADKKYVKVVTF